MSISLPDIKEKLEKAYNSEDWSIVEDILETLSYEIENSDDIFEQYKEDEDWWKGADDKN